MQTITLLKNDFKKEESRNIDREIALEKKIKQLDNIVFKRDQSAQTVHMLTKPQFFYDHTTKQALGFQNPFYLKKAQQLEPKLYDGNVIKNMSAIVIPDSEETLMLAEESRSKMLLKQKDPMMLEKKVNTTPNYVNSPDPTLSSRPTKVEVPKELPKISMVNYGSLSKTVTSASGSQPLGNTKKDKIQQTPSSTQKNKVEAHPRKVKSSLKNKDCVVIPKGTACVQHSKLNANSEIKCVKVYYVEGLGHNLFFVGQFCDSNLEVAFRQHTCFIRNLEGVDLLTGSQGNNLYTLSLGDMMASSPICLLSKASKTKSWLWHRRLSHLNFGAINHLARHGLVRGLPKLKFEKDHLCSACAMGKSKKKPHKPKSEDTNQEKLYLLHMDLCGPMRVASVNGKKYILVIVDDYSRFTWVKCLRSKDEAPNFIIKFLKMIQVRLKVPVRRIKTDNGTEFVNQTLREYYEKVGISHETSVARSPQQNGVVERRNRTLIEVAHTMLIYAKASLFLWAKAVATACYTQNRSIIRLRHGKTPMSFCMTNFLTYHSSMYLVHFVIRQTIARTWASYNQKLILVFSLAMYPQRKHFEFTTDVPDESLRQYM
ncbi:retrovirus-related pol polyprotein from transposon TNT 1-94 [Tanacetum coccineum]